MQNQKKCRATSKKCIFLSKLLVVRNSNYYQNYFFWRADGTLFQGASLMRKGAGGGGRLEHL